MMSEKLVQLCVGVWLVGLSLALVAALAWLWPPANGAASLTLPWGNLPLPIESRYLLLVLLAGALGSYVHLATSFVDFSGNRRFVASWAWWYLLRTSVGACLALLVYCTVRGGLVQGPGESLNPYGIVSLAGMSGLFSRQATDKLRELFDNLFRTDSAPLRHDPLPEAGGPAAQTEEPRH